METLKELPEDYQRDIWKMLEERGEKVTRKRYDDDDDDHDEDDGRNNVKANVVAEAAAGDQNDNDADDGTFDIQLPPTSQIDFQLVSELPPDIRERIGYRLQKRNENDSKVWEVDLGNEFKGDEGGGSDFGRGESLHAEVTTYDGTAFYGKTSSTTTTSSTSSSSNSRNNNRVRIMPPPGPLEACLLRSKYKGVFVDKTSKESRKEVSFSVSRNEDVSVIQTDTNFTVRDNVTRASTDDDGGSCGRGDNDCTHNAPEVNDGPASSTSSSSSSIFPSFPSIRQSLLSYLSDTPPSTTDSRLLSYVVGCANEERFEDVLCTLRLVNRVGGDEWHEVHRKCREEVNRVMREKGMHEMVFD